MSPNPYAIPLPPGAVGGPSLGPSPDGLLADGRRIGATMARMMRNVTDICPDAHVAVQVETLTLRVTPGGECFLQPAAESQAWLPPARLTLLAGILAGMADTARLASPAQFVKGGEPG